MRLKIRIDMSVSSMEDTGRLNMQGRKMREQIVEVENAGISHVDSVLRGPSLVIRIQLWDFYKISFAFDHLPSSCR